MDFFSRKGFGKGLKMTLDQAGVQLACVIKRVMNIGSGIWKGMPLWIALAAGGLVIFLAINMVPDFVDLKDLAQGNLNEAEKQTLTMATELNKFLISLVTAMFGAVGFYLINYREKIQTKWVAGAFFISLVLLGFTYYFGFMSYSQMTAELAQGALGMTPSKSRILYYLEMEAWTFLGASLTMLSIFIFAIIQR
jgi:hypothetical protein